jgi:DNA-directed RNA polymerase sigma subunit (sigma70/sigma32)
MTLQAIAHRMDYSKQRIEQIEKRALAALRRLLASGEDDRREVNCA